MVTPAVRSMRRPTKASKRVTQRCCGQDPGRDQAGGLVEMLRRPEGVRIAEVVETTGWQPDAVRGVLAGALQKRLGLTIGSEKVEGGAAGSTDSFRRDRPLSQNGHEPLPCCLLRTKSRLFSLRRAVAAIA